VSPFETTLGRYRLVFGPGTLGRLGELARDVGGRRVLVVTDRGIRRAGHVDRALEALEGAGIDSAVYDGVEPNPTGRHVEEGVAAARAARADCLIGLGGGSAMDCAKGVNFVLTGGGRIEDYRGWGKLTRPMLPSLGVPTTAGTGSEAQSYALICEETTHHKMACGDPQAMFHAVLLDPELLPGVQREVAATAGLDALSHAVESHVSKAANPVSRLFSREAFDLVASGLPGVLDGTADPDTWGRVLLGAHFAGAAIERSMLGAAHACANPLTARFPIAHGAAVALMLPHVVRFNASVAQARYAELAPAVETQVRELRAAARLPHSLADCAVPRECLPELSAEAEAQWTAGFNPRPVTRVELLALYEAAHEDRI
jgi:alcohol dehydrogenase